MQFKLAFLVWYRFYQGPIPKDYTSVIIPLITIWTQTQTKFFHGIFVLSISTANQKPLNKIWIANSNMSSLMSENWELRSENNNISHHWSQLASGQLESASVMMSIGEIIPRFIGRTGVSERCMSTIKCTHQKPNLILSIVIQIQFR